MKKFKISKILVQIPLFLWLIIQLYPMLFMIFSSLKTEGEIIASPFSLPSKLYLDNYITAWNGNSSTTVSYNMKQFLVNSIVITVISLVCLCFVAMLAGYSLARFRFPGYKFVYILIVCLIAIPTQSLIVSIFTTFESLGWLNKPLAMIPLYTTFNLPFSIVIMKTNFEAVPHQIEESAYLDGCNKFQTFLHIAAPACRGSIATIAIVNLTNVWSEYMYSSMLLMLPESRTLPVAISLFNSNMYNSSLGPLYAGLTIASIPLLLAYFVFQKQIVKGMMVGAIK